MDISLKSVQSWLMISSKVIMQGLSGGGGGGGDFPLELSSNVNGQLLYCTRVSSVC